MDDILATTLSLGSAFGALTGVSYVFAATVGAAIALPVGVVGAIALFVAGKLAR